MSDNEQWRNIVDTEAELYRIENRYGNQRTVDGSEEIEHVHPNWACGGLQRKVQPYDEEVRLVLAEASDMDARHYTIAPVLNATPEYWIIRAATAIREAKRLKQLRLHKPGCMCPWCGCCPHDERCVCPSCLDAACIGEHE